MSAREGVAAELARHEGRLGPRDDDRPEVWVSWCSCGWEGGDHAPGYRERWHLHLADAVLAVARDLERCRHGRYRIDACLGCGRRYAGTELVGPFVPAEGQP